MVILTATDGHVYTFETQKSIGDDGEAIQDRYWSCAYTIRHATGWEQRAGIDRVFRPRTGGQSFTVEYKNDVKAGITNNVWIETVSQDANGKAGWVYSCRAQHLMIYVPAWDVIYALKVGRLRSEVRTWIESYGVKTSKNPSYFTYGVPVPRKVIEAFASSIHSGVLAYSDEVV